MTDPIEHVIVLMMENCSFDRMLGRLPGVHGVDPTRPRTNPDFPPSALIKEAIITEPNMALDPEHDLDDCLRQISGPCEGFVADFAQHYPQATAELRAEVMGYYTPDFLGVLYTLGSLSSPVITGTPRYLVPDVAESLFRAQRNVFGAHDHARWNLSSRYSPLRSADGLPAPL